jgi:hypothetical protein
LADHRDLLDDIAERLLENEAIEHDEIQEIMASTRDSSEQPTTLAELEGAADAATALASEPPDERR